jgi:hypothetical protein
MYGLIPLRRVGSEAAGGISFFENLGPINLMTRAKFQCSNKTITTDSGWDYLENASTTKEVANIELLPVTGGSEENKSFFKSTPNGKIELRVLNLAAAEMFEIGKEYYVDFTVAN